MRRIVTTAGNVLGLFALGLLCSATLPPAEAWAQTVRAESFGVAVRTATVSEKSPVAVLPAEGGMVSDQAPSVSVSGLADAQNVFAIASGATDLGPRRTPESSAESNSTLESVNLLGGLITADGVVAVASTAITSTVVNSNAEGSELANVVVNGVAIGDAVAPNTRVDLPGVGYVVLNEQIPTGDGVTTSGITVNMIHVVLQQPILGLLGQVIGYQTVGNIIVGSATSSVMQ
jgi:hypothetical protein